MTETAAKAWRHAGLLFALGTALLFGLFHDTAAGMVRIWSTSDTFGFGFLILPIVVYLTHQRRRQLALLVPQACFSALLWIAGALLAHLIGAVANIALFQQLAFVGLWQGLFALVFGWPVVRQMVFPLFFLVFAVPMGEEVIPLLQKITAEIAVFLLRSTGIPTFHSGVLIEIPSGSFVVADVCSGARFLITTFVLGLLATHIFFRSWHRRIIFMLLCVVVPVLANGLRAYGTIILAHFVDRDLAISVDHIVYGFIFLAFVLLILTALGAAFRDRWLNDQALAPVAPQAGRRLSVSYGAFVLAALLLVGGKTWSLQVAGPPPAAAAVELAALQPGAPWTRAETPLAGWAPTFRGADAQLLRSYEGGEGEVAFFIAHYRYQRPGHEIIANGNTFVAHGRDYHVTRFEKIEVTVDGQELVLQEMGVRRPEGVYLLWAWYDIGGSRTASPVAGKLLEVWHKLRGGSPAATAFALLTASSSDLDNDRARLEAFLTGLSEDGSLTVTEVRPGS